MQENPIQIINSHAASITEEELSQLVPELVEYYSRKIKYLSYYVYGQDRGLPLSAFRAWAAETIESGSKTFLFQKQHWKTGRNIGPYLYKCLERLADTLKKSYNCMSSISMPICPACKSLGCREFLIHESRMLRCPCCTREIYRLEDSKRTIREEYELNIRRVFSLHSSKGYKCPDCGGFIPESVINNQTASCPYDNCTWFGDKSNLIIMNHPIGSNSGFLISLNAPVNNSFTKEEGSEMQSLIDGNEINCDLRIAQSQKYEKELKITKEVLKIQKSRLEDTNKVKGFKKQLMYQAFEDLLEEDPASMISYLIHGKSIGERPIQSQIFQKYIWLIENKLPLELIGKNGKVEFLSLLDPELELFLGISEYNAFVRESGIVPNNTHEVFVGAKCNGPCFIGYLCDVLDKNNKSLLSEVEYYTFSNLKMKSTIPQETMLKIIHFRMPPHYEMFSLVLLQRTKTKIINSIYKRLNGETRQAKERVSYGID